MEGKAGATGQEYVSCCCLAELVLGPIAAAGHEYVSCCAWAELVLGKLATAGYNCCSAQLLLLRRAGETISIMVISIMEVLDENDKNFQVWFKGNAPNATDRAL
ncbi:unnamed protein product [Calypogeia fissa]